jgi:plastocyanin
MTLRPAVLACIAAFALAASPASPAPPAETRLAVTLANFDFSPSTISLVHGQAYALELINTAGGGHNFVAPKFFAAAQVSASDRARIVKGGVEVPGGERVTIHLVAPAAGRYPLKCSHLFHSTFGMKGTIVVT